MKTHGTKHTGENFLRCIYVNGQLYERIIRNGLELFVDDDHTRAA